MTLTATKFATAPNVAQLPNGVRIIHLAIPSSVAVGVSLGVDVGSADEPAQWAGIAHFLEHLVFRGTEAYPSSTAIGEAVESIGGEYNAFTGKSYTQFICSTPKSHGHLSALIPAELVARPLLREVDVSDERPVVLQEIALGEDNSWQRAIRAFEQVMWPGTTMARPIIGYVETLQRLSARDVREFWSAHYAPRNTVFAIVGDLTLAEGIDLADRVLGSWSPPTSTAIPPSVTPSTASSRVRWEVMDDRREAVFALGSAVGPWNSVPHGPLAVLSALIAEGEGSLFARRLVRRASLLHQTGVLAWLNRDAGAFGFTSAARPDLLERAVAASLELLNAQKRGIKPSDFKRALGYARGEALRQWQRPLDAATQLCHQALMGESDLGPDADVTAIESVRSDALEALLVHQLAKERLGIAIAGPAGDEQRIEQLLNP
ncbi:MAG: insulinase family protein [Chloroflexi bacterium]|nr:insulinase family protein [Chloroflexota bacterium]